MLQTSIRSRARYILAIRSNTISSTQMKTFTYKRRMQRLFNDGIDLNHQSIEINSIEHIRRCSLHKDDDIWTLYKTMCPQVRTLGDALHEGFKVSNDGPCVGIVQTLNGIKSLQWLSYSTVIEQSQSIGSYLWRRTKLTPSKSKVAILSSNRPEYLFVEQACYMYGFIVVSMYTTYNSTAIQKILQRTEAEVLIIDNLDRIKSIKKELLDNNQIKEILVMDEIGNEETNKIRSISSILKTTDICERPRIDPDEIATFILTSGTTGEPKIAMLSHENLLAATKGNLVRLYQAHIKKPITNRHCSFLPMAHIFERFVILQILLKGTEVVFCPSPDKLVEYLSIVKPTQASVVPRVLNKVYDIIMADVNRSKIKQYFLQQALREQLPFLSRVIFRKVKNLFGGELKAMITGSAPIKADVMHFFRIALDITIIEGYGQTESCAAGSTTHPIDMSYGTVGSPGPNVEIKLIDVPDTHYRSEMNQGEVCIRGPTIFKGYYGDEEKTRETVDKDGWLHTGDVGEWTSHGALRIIDRSKHIFKLSQGKYIAPERLEDVYVRSQWIAQIFIDSISSETTVVAIVIPDEEYIRKNFKSKIDSNVSSTDLCKDKQLKEIILSDIVRLAKEQKLEYYEIPSNIHLHYEPFTQQNDLLTITFKIRRMNARKRFQLSTGTSIVCRVSMIALAQRILFCLVLQVFVASLNINVDLTDWTEQCDNCPELAHHCLHVPGRTQKDLSYQMLSYCLSEWPSTWQLTDKSFDPKFTFVDLYRKDVTSEHLYIWSAPMDLIERYQFYVNQRALEKESGSMDMDVFFNCTLPRFGSQCQYKLDSYRSDYSSLKELVYDFYSIPYEPASLTCYEHLECQRASTSICLAWYEICDGIVHCLNDAIDEIHCWKVQLEKCDDDQSQCYNGQCISRTFWQDAQLNFECLDRSDQFYRVTQIDHNPYIRDPTFLLEDVQFSSNYPNVPHGLHYSSISKRIERLDEIILSEIPASMSPQCWLAFKCYYEMNNENQDSHCETLTEQLKRCNPIVVSDPTACDSSMMYKCWNSSRCIFIGQLCDRINDCLYADDEQCSLINERCSALERYDLFKCSNTNKCLSHRLVNDDICHCPHQHSKLCDDEKLSPDARIDFIPFSAICNGFTQLLPVLINGRNETDENECDQWQCNNTYTRCNHQWNCFNGIDELNCQSESLPNCSHRCVSPHTYQFICLPLEKVNDGDIDCVGATDELKICRLTQFRSEKNFFCNNDSTHSCIQSSELCAENNRCSHGEDARLCSPTQNETLGQSICQEEYRHIRSDVQTFFCERYEEKFGREFENFALHGRSFRRQQIIAQVNNRLPAPLPSLTGKSSVAQRCHRGLPLTVSSIKACLCPPSYYGSTCQYENERVSLTLRFEVTAGSRRTLFTFVVSLTDDNNDERLIYSFQQHSFLYVRDCQMKYNIYLLYPTRPRHPSHNYSVHIDIYEKISLSYRGSFLLPVKYSFLPVNRLAVHLTIPRQTNEWSTCSTRSCAHGRCVNYVNNDRQYRTFCQCDQGWTGKSCTIPHLCQCAPGSLCLGISATNQSVCICPVNRWGSRCFLKNNVCEEDENELCLNGGQCIPIDEQLIRSDTFFCLCPKGYVGKQCEISRTNFTLTFDENIRLPSLITVHFIDTFFQNDNQVTNGSLLQTMPYNQRTITIYWSNRFHIAFVQLVVDYYLLVVQPEYDPFISYQFSIVSADRCRHVSEVLNSTITSMHHFRRMKFYQIPCQRFPQLKCFYDEFYFCLCYSFGDRNLSNCFNFHSKHRSSCSGLSECENGGECIQDKPQCSQSSMCLCPKCFHGNRCQFNSRLSSLSLDTILSYHVRPQLPIGKQPTVVLFIQKTGCGLYLFVSSISTVATMVLFLSNQCFTLDFFLRLALTMDQYLHGCVAVERAMTVIKGVNFNQKRSQQMAKYVVENKDRLSLSDIIMAHVYIRSLLIYDYSIPNLEKSFNEYLHLYCPQAFQTIIYEENSPLDGRIVNCENEQERKVFSSESRTNESILKYLNNNFSIEDLFPYDLIPTNTSPLIFLHQIHFQDGTILVFGCHHHLSDGYGFSLLGQRFSLWFQGKQPTLFDHDRSKLRYLAALSSVQFDHEEMSVIAPIYSLSNLISTKTIIQRYTKQYLFDKFKIQNTNVSMNDILVGWLTKVISRIRHISLQTIVKVGMAMNGRMILPDIDENYFGNCTFSICFSFSMFDLNNLTVNELAQRLNLEKRKLMTREYIQSALAFIDKHHHLSRIHLGWEPAGGIDLSFSNWSKFPLYKCDFGQGKTKSFQIPQVIFDGLILILPTSNDNEIEIHITLKDQHAQLLLDELI
ncbi:hypothetical protein I4U23_027615 [Adineta vaga]|nr:hypothetical protein I4U23_027615 [Adineta vaga]